MLSRDYLPMRQGAVSKIPYYEIRRNDNTEDEEIKHHSMMETIATHNNDKEYKWNDQRRPQ